MKKEMIKNGDKFQFVFSPMKMMYGEDSFEVEKIEKLEDNTYKIFFKEKGDEDLLTVISESIVLEDNYLVSTGNLKLMKKI